MATTNLNIRIDKVIKDQAEAIFNELGLKMTDGHLAEMQGVFVAMHP